MPSTRNTQGSSTYTHLQVLEHVNRFRLTIPEIFAHAFSMTAPQANALLAELVELKLLSTAPFRDGSCYYHLTQLGAKAIGVPSEDAKPLKVCHHAIAYGTLYYSTMLDAPKKRLTKHEFMHDFPDIYQPGPQINYVLQPDGKLSFVRLDGDISVRVRPGSWERLLSTVSKLYEQRRKNEAFSCLIENGYFNVVILTATLPKVAQVRRLVQEVGECFQQYLQNRWCLPAGQRKPSPAPIFEIEYIPGLFQLMRPRPHIPAIQSTKVF